MARYKIRTGPAAAIVVVTLAIASASQARKPIEGGDGKGGTAAKVATTRFDGGYSALSGLHVKNPFEDRTE
jgi:hypothetical protein